MKFHINYLNKNNTTIEDKNIEVNSFRAALKRIWDDYIPRGTVQVIVTQETSDAPPSS